MKNKSLSSLIVIVFFVSLFNARPLRAEMDPKLKAFTTMCLYGVAGGALLGTASLAFGAKGRAIPIGASLGLYAGILAGAYILYTHEYLKANPDDFGGVEYPEDNVGPYQDKENNSDENSQQDEEAPSDEEASIRYFKGSYDENEVMRISHGSFPINTQWFVPLFSQNF